jgi:hypothetical protein
LARGWSLEQRRFDTVHVKSELEFILVRQTLLQCRAPANASKDAVATLPKLTGLRTRNPPEVQYATTIDPTSHPVIIREADARLLRLCMQNFADQVLTYLTSRGSPVQILVIELDIIRLDEVFSERCQWTRLAKLCRQEGGNDGYPRS